MITYSSEGVKFPSIKKRETSNWIHRVIESYGKKVGEIGYMFVNDEKILEVNNEYLGHDYYTDIRCSTAIWLYHSILSLRMLTSSAVLMMRSSIVSSFTASSTFVVSTIKDLVNGKSWKPQKKKRWLCSKHRQRFLIFGKAAADALYLLPLSRRYKYRRHPEFSGAYAVLPLRAGNYARQYSPDGFQPAPPSVRVYS